MFHILKDYLFPSRANENAPNLHFIFLTFQKCNSDSLDSWMETVIESPTEGSVERTGSSKEQLNL